MMSLRTHKENPVDPISIFAAACDEANAVLAKVGADQWTTQSPCAEWDVRGVVNHMTGGALMVAAAVAGSDFAHVDDYVGTDPAASFKSAADAAVSALRADPSILGRTLKMPFGEMPGAAVAGVFANDELAHAWDVAKATGQSTDLNPMLAEGCLAAAKQMITADFRKPGFFDAETVAPEGASAADRLAAFLGRQV
jgi:uncharacterized protein (TIGR03086 family)